MDTVHDNFEQQQRMREKYASRTTVKKSDVVAICIDQANATHEAASRYSATAGEYCGGVKDAIMSIVEIFGGYAGFEDRQWAAFCEIDGWHDIYRALSDFDRTHGTDHQARFIKGILRTNQTRFYLGGNSKLHTTPNERRRARHFAERYAKVLGITL